MVKTKEDTPYYNWREAPMGGNGVNEGKSPTIREGLTSSWDNLGLPESTRIWGSKEQKILKSPNWRSGRIAYLLTGFQ